MHGAEDWEVRLDGQATQTPQIMRALYAVLKHGHYLGDLKQCSQTDRPEVFYFPNTMFLELGHFI